MLIAGLLLLIAAAGGAWLYARSEARADPVFRHLRLALPGLSAGAKPVRVALLSDVHIGSAAMDGHRLARIADQINARHPDLVLIAGDFIYGHDPADGARLAGGLTGPLSRLKAPLGVIAVPGNHDHWTGVRPVREALEAAGVTVLANRAVRRGPLLVLGFDDSFSGHARCRGDAGLGDGAGRRTGGAHPFPGADPAAAAKREPAARGAYPLRAGGVAADRRADRF